MKISYAWLCEMVATGLDPAALGHALTMAGLALEGIAGEGATTVLDLAATTNRPDWLSHYGVAREVAAVTGASLHPLQPPPLPESATAAASALRVTIAAPDACGLYLARVLDAVTVAPAPAPIARRLELLGHRSINNIADLTNYTLQETGHPTHAFDADRIRGAHIYVRFARAGETLVTLDEVKRTLDPGDLIIADAEGPLALAGVLGGLHSAISPATRRVVIESAWFDPQAVRRTAKRHGLRTEASFRFERGVDPGSAEWAADRIAARAATLGATVLAGRVEARTVLPARRPIPLRASTLQRLLGLELPPGEVRAALERLGLTPSGQHWIAPSWRFDLAQEADLVEEVARLLGYDRFPARLPAFHGSAARNPALELRDRVRQLLRGHGYAEALSLSFAAAAECREFSPLQPVRVSNPLSDEAAILQTSALPAMLHLLANNLNRGEANPRLFELAKRYWVQAGQPREAAVLAIGAAGSAQLPHWSARPRPFDFYDLKGELEALFDLFHLEPRNYAPQAHGFHPGRSAQASAGGVRLAVMGQLSPALAAAWKLDGEVWLAEIDLDALLAAGSRPVAFHPPSRFPASERDFSFVFPDSVPWQRVRQALHQPAIAGLCQVEPLEVFRSAQLGSGVHSLLLRARFQRDDRTLRDDEVQAAAEEIARRLRQLGGTQR